MLARDERTGETHTRKVTALHKRVAAAVLWLTLAAPAEAAPDLHLASLAEPSFNVEQIGTTPEHPFYVEGKGWTPAGALKACDRIVALDGPSLEVIALRLDETPATVYNLTVASDQSFFVGELGAWGHNTRKRPSKRPPLPTTDPTGKVHGDLPTIAELKNYPAEELLDFANDLTCSIPNRIAENAQYGRRRPHGQRQGREQQLLNWIINYLGR